MKQFGSLLLAAVLGSVITIAAVEWMGDKKDGVRIEHVSTPISQVGYKVNEKGETVPLDFTNTAERVTAAVVHIKSTSQGRVASRQERNPFEEFFGPGAGSPQQRGPSQSSGSGVIINPAGYIVTNNHVVEGADIVEVTLADNRSYKAEVVGTDPDTDLAVIKINQTELPYLSFVDSDKAKVGQWVLAVGNPFNLNSTVTAGIISAKGRNINIINSNNPDNPEAGRTAIESFIQTDAAINPGNSGGALVDLNGGLLGINTAIASPTGSYSGYGFAVPSDIVSKIAEDLIGHGTVQRGWLGITVQNVSGDLAREFELTVSDGAYVAGFGNEGDKSAAKDAGVKEGDVVVKLDETPIHSSTALIEYIGRKRPGDKVDMTVNRKGKTVVIPVTLKNRENLAAAKMVAKDPVASLGVTLEDVEQGKLKRLELSSGVLVKEIKEGKIERYTDMREGFIVTQIDDVKVKSAKELNDFLKKKKSGELVTFSGVYEDYPREYIYAIRM